MNVWDFMKPYFQHHSQIRNLRFSLFHLARESSDTGLSLDPNRTGQNLYIATTLESVTVNYIPSPNDAITLIMASIAQHTVPVCVISLELNLRLMPCEIIKVIPPESSNFQQAADKTCIMSIN